MANPIHQTKQDKANNTDYFDRVAFRKRVEAELSILPERLPGGVRNSLKIRASNRFLRFLSRTGLHLRSNTSELQLLLENTLGTPLARLISTGQLTYGDVLLIRMLGNSGELQIERVSSRRRKESAFFGKTV